MAIAGYLILNQDLSFQVPMLNIEYKPWRMYLVACSLPSLLCAVAVLFFPESPKFLYSKVNLTILKLTSIASAGMTVIETNWKRGEKIIMKTSKAFDKNFHQKKRFTTSFKCQPTFLKLHVIFISSRLTNFLST